MNKYIFIFLISISTFSCQLESNSLDFASFQCELLDSLNYRLKDRDFYYKEGEYFIINNEIEPIMLLGASNYLMKHEYLNNFSAVFDSIKIKPNNIHLNNNIACNDNIRFIKESDSIDFAHSKGICNVSQIMQTQDAAIFYFDASCGRTCGLGFFVELNKSDNSEGKIKQLHQVWH